MFYGVVGGDFGFVVLGDGLDGVVFVVVVVCVDVFDVGGLFYFCGV